MKKVLKICCIIIMVLFVLFWIVGEISYQTMVKPNLGRVEVTSSGRDNNSIIEEHIRKYNNICPIEIPLGKVTNLSIEDSSIVYNFITNIDIENYNYYATKHCRFVELGQYILYGNSPKFDKYLDALVNNGYTLKFRGTTTLGDTLKDMAITSKEFLTTKAYVKRFPDEALREYISLMLCLQNRNLPIDIGNGMAILSIIQQDNSFVYRMLLDENYTIGFLRDKKKSIRQDLLNGMATQNGYGTILQACKLTKSGITLRWIVEHQNDSIDFSFNYHELQYAISKNNPNIIKSLKQ